MAAAAKAPGPADARIPCPLCGGLIHPIAGRCKHCKEDVSATRSSRPAAAPLPALQGGAQPALYSYGAGHTNGHGNGHVRAKTHPANAHMAVPIAMRTPLEDASQPILPPRQTSRMQASGTTAPPASWKSWPVVVIGIAVVAIIVAVILMVWPPGGATKADAKTLAPPPAPERMDTNPTPATPPPSSADDPWKANPGAAPDPAPSQPHAQPTVPDIDDIQPPNLSDPFRGGGNSNMLGMTSAILKRACDRLATCPTADDTMKTFCEAGRLALPNTPPPSCSAAQRCLAQVDALPCDDLDAATAMGMMQGVQDCIEAMRC
jgi:hypothetical protein